MQVEMRKREQELLARIKEQQRELDTVKAEKSKVRMEDYCFLLINPSLSIVLIITLN